MKLELTDSRRLTGANLFWDRPGAIIDAVVDAAPDALVRRWEKHVRVLLDAVGHANEATCHRVFDGGVSLLISAPIDALYAMCELNEVAWARAASDLCTAPMFARVDAVIAEKADNLMNFSQSDRQISSESVAGTPLAENAC